MQITDLFNVEGKVAIVTGGSRGIGFMIAEGLVSNGVRVYITACKAEACDDAARRLSELGECISFPADLSDAAGIESFVERFSEREDRLDILVNNAGTNVHYGLSTEITELMFDKIMALNVKGPFLLSQHAVNLMKENGGGVIINISSVAGLRAAPMQVVYGMSKFAVIGMTKGMAKEFGRVNIRVNAIAPGAIATSALEIVLKNEALEAEMKRRTPLGRLGVTQDIAAGALYLASDASGYVTGRVLDIDGGLKGSNLDMGLPDLE